MFKLVSGFFYLISLLPLRVLYLLGDIGFFFLYHVIGYRRRVVAANLAIAFPEKNHQERKKISRQFYRLFTDSFIETIKLISMSKREFDRRITGNFDVVNNLYESKTKVQIHSGHFFNWEFMNLACSARLKYPFIGIYMPVSNKIIDRIIYNMRSKYGTILISAFEFRTTFHKYSQSDYAIGLIADQNASNLNTGKWYNFFGKPAPFVVGPEKGAKRNNTAVVMVNFYRKKRGYYEANFKLLTTDPRSTEDGYITRALINFIQESVKQNPANYLWTHRRWKHIYDAAQHGPIEG